MTSKPFNLENTDLPRNAPWSCKITLKRRKTFDLQLPCQSSLPLALFSFPGHPSWRSRRVLKDSAIAAATKKGSVQRKTGPEVLVLLMGSAFSPRSTGRGGKSGWGMGKGGKRAKFRFLLWRSLRESWGRLCMT